MALQVFFLVVYTHWVKKLQGERAQIWEKSGRNARVWQVGPAICCLATIACGGRSCWLANTVHRSRQSTQQGTSIQFLQPVVLKSWICLNQLLRLQISISTRIKESGGGSLVWTEIDLESLRFLFLNLMGCCFSVDWCAFEFSTDKSLQISVVPILSPPTRENREFQNWKLSFFRQRNTLSTSFYIFVITYRVTNFLPKLRHAIIFYWKNWISIFGFTLLSGYAHPPWRFLCF